MHPHNHTYGQARQLYRYARGRQYDFPPSVPGHLQHDLDDGRGCTGEYERPTLPSFVWSEQVRRRRYAHGHRHDVVIGSAWLYLLRATEREHDAAERKRRLVVAASNRRSRRSGEPAPAMGGAVVDDPEDEDPGPVRDGLLWLPDHGRAGAGAGADEVAALAEELARDVADRSSSAVTVALSHADFRRAPVHNAYARFGFDVVSLSSVGTAAEGSGGPYLGGLQNLVAASVTAASNVLRPELVYAAAGGCGTDRFGRMPGESPAPSGTGPRALPTGSRTRASVRHGAQGGPGDLADLAAGPQTAAVAGAIAAAELGADALKEPEELATMLEWYGRE